MAQQTINFGTPPAGTDGDTTRTALEKLESNDDELYAAAAANAQAASAAATAAAAAQTTANAASAATAATNVFLSHMSGLKNKLINGDGSANRRGFAGGAIPAGAYCYDQWKADTGGANATVSGGIWTLTSGTIVQPIEAPQLQGKTVTLSVENPSGTLTVTVDGQVGQITVGAGRRGVTFTIAAGSTGNILVKLAGTAVTFKNIQLEIGTAPTDFEVLPPALVDTLLSRYCVSTSLTNGVGFAAGVQYNATGALVQFSMGVAMRATPAMTIAGQIRWSGTGTSTTNPTFASSGSSLTCYMLVFTISGGTAGSAGYAAASGGNAIIVLDAGI